MSDGVMKSEKLVRVRVRVSSLAHHLLTHSLTHLTHSLTHSLTHPLTHSLTVLTHSLQARENGLVNVPYAAGALGPRAGV